MKVPLTDAEKIERRKRMRAKRLKREHTEKTAQKHQRVRRYIVLAKRKTDGVLFGFYDANPKKWSENIVTLYDGNRWSRYRDNDRPKRILRDVTAKCSDDMREKFDIFIVRAGSKQCPVKIDYQNMYNNHKKFNSHVIFTLR